MKEASISEILCHNRMVRDFMMSAALEIINRGSFHDLSKLSIEESDLWDSPDINLKDYEYGTIQYDNAKNCFREARLVHYKNNTHHPEHYPNGIDGMNLFDIIEMYFDWLASCEKIGMQKSITINKRHYNMSDQLTNIFLNTFNK